MPINTAKQIKRYVGPTHQLYNLIISFYNASAEIFSTDALFNGVCHFITVFKNGFWEILYFRIIGLVVPA
ncbi:hypothetical protein SDC9_186551 [bioreactor metagenome]|uniref:Uncharacterized protein n=1 Tax=bioreactor metagenome TaxID=1076179 RepID=A0A645HJ35_9ZZZZ